MRVTYILGKFQNWSNLPTDSYIIFFHYTRTSTLMKDINANEIYLPDLRTGVSEACEQTIGNVH